MKNIKTYIIESSQQINESVKNYPNVKELGHGEFDGILWGHCFLFNEQKYYSEVGWKNMFPMYCKMVINEEKAWPCQIDKYQREELKKLFK